MVLDVNRVEKKYIINPVDARILKDRLKLYMKEDAHNRDDGYRVRSVYFDSYRNQDYCEKNDGVDNRKKIRLRVYDPGDDSAKLELKEKAGGVQRKRSLNVSKEVAMQLIAGDYSALTGMKDPLAMKLYTIMQMEVYRPKSMVEYDRFAYMLDDNDTRITFDSNIRASESNFDLFDNQVILTPVSEASEITLEVKYNRFLMSNIKKALSYKAYMQTSNSKYIKSRGTYRVF